MEKWTFHTESPIQKETPSVSPEVQSQNDTAHYNEAQTKKDPTLCALISDPLEQTRCRDNITLILALQAKDRSLCISLSGSMLTRCEDTVIYSLATEAKNKTLCHDIVTEQTRQTCLEEQEEILLRTIHLSGSVTGDLCAGFETKWKTECDALIVRVDETGLYRDAIAKKDLSLCDRITDEALRFQCRDIVLVQSAIASSDATICDGVHDTTKQNSCYSQASLRSDVTRFQAFIASGSLRDCETLSTETYKNQCHDMVIIRTVRTSKDTSLCQELSATGMIDRCEKTGGK